MNFPYIDNTPITLNGKPHIVRFENGMTGIGSRKFWLDNKEYFRNGVFHTEDITQGNHLLYLIKWRDTPWDKVYLFIAEKYENELLVKENSWREPRKIEVEEKP
jgi:hypothetical protein